MPAFPISRRAVLALPAVGLALGATRAGAADTPKRGGTLTYAVAAEPPTYDMHQTGTFPVMHCVSPHYSTLMRYEPGNYPNIIGDLAESFQSSEDMKTFTFRLRPGVKFHDGTVLTSEDVRASYARMISPPDGIVSARLELFRKIGAVEAPEPLTVVFRMKEVDASIMDTFASPWNVIYSAARLKQDPKFPVKNVIGTGPFRFVEHVAGSHWVGERFDGYFRPEHPYLDGYRAIIMASSAVVNALSGRQILAEFRGLTPNERNRVAGTLGNDAVSYEGGWMTHMILSFNCEQAPFSDARVRRAISLAVDRWDGSKSLKRISQLGDVGGMVRPGSPWSASREEMERWPGYATDMKRNREEARRLLKEAGVENLTFTLLNRNHEPYVTAGIFVIDQLRQIGVKVEHKQVELSAWYSAQTSGNFQVLMDSATPISDDPTATLVKYVSQDRSSIVVTRIKDRELDRLYDEQAREPDRQRRRALVREFEARAMQEAYAVPLLWWQRIVVMNKRVRGWTMSPLQMIYQDLGDLWLAPEGG